VRDFPEEVKVEDVKTTDGFVRDFPQKVKVEDVKTTISCETSLKKHSEGLGTQTIACATLGLCNLRGTLSPSDHLRPYSKTTFRATIAPRAGHRR